jgi:large exoprotein involved in heme utilization and adhesion
LTINTGKLTVSNRGEVSVRSTTLGDAGTLTVNTGSILLDEGKITATSDNAKGGNINLTASDLLLMRDRSLISAQSFGTNSQDGNITIDTDFVIALPSENSDIIARSTNQGDIDITADSVIGYQYGELTPLSDITASGTVTLNVPNVDPTQGLTQFPTELVDPTQQIDQSCAAREEDESKFTVIGRTGLPQSPNEVLTPDMVLDDLGTLASREGDAGRRVDEDAKNAPTTPSTSNSQSALPLIPREDSEFPNRPKQLVEAQGWVVDAQGKVTLVAQAPTVIPHPLAVTSASCHTPQLPHR